MPAVYPTYPEIEEDGIRYSWDDTRETVTVNGEGVTVVTRRGSHPNKPAVTTMMAIEDHSSRMYTVVGDEDEARQTVAKRAVNGEAAPLRERLLAPKYVPTSEPRTYEDTYSPPAYGALLGLVGGLVGMGGLQLATLFNGLLKAVIIGASLTVAVPLMLVTMAVVTGPILRFTRDSFWYTRYIE